MVPCLGRLVWYYFPDKNSGFGGIIMFEMMIFISQGWGCGSTAIAKSGGPHIKCKPGCHLNKC